MLHNYIKYSIYTFILYKNIDSEELTAPLYSYDWASFASVRKKKIAYLENKEFLFFQWRSLTVSKASSIIWVG